MIILQILSSELSSSQRLEFQIIENERKSNQFTYKYAKYSIHNQCVIENQKTEKNMTMRGQRETQQRKYLPVYSQETCSFKTVDMAGHHSSAVK